MRLLAASLAALTLALGCAGPEIRFDYDAKAGYQAYHSYDWYAAGKAVRDPGAQNGITDNRVRRAVEAELAARSFRREPSADPDFLVTYYPVYQPRHSRRPRVGIGLGLGPMRGLGLGLGVSAPVGARASGQIGSIVLEIQDFKSHQLVWRAVAEGVLDDTQTPEDADDSVTQAVRKMLTRFPPTGKS